MDVFWIEYIFKFNKENFQHISNNHSVLKHQVYNKEINSEKLESIFFVDIYRISKDIFKVVYNYNTGEYPKKF